MPDLETIRPARSSNVAQSVGDVAGGTTYSGATEGSAGEIAFGGPTADFILYGVVNGAFAQGPPNAAADIDPQNNPMPYWSGPTQVSGGAITCQWVVDTSSPSGYNLRFSVPSGAAADEAYMEQIIPIGGLRDRKATYEALAQFYRVTASDSNFSCYVSLRTLDVAGGAIGAESEVTIPIVSDATMGSDTALATNGAGTLSTAAYVRLRIGIRRTSGSTNTGTFDCVGVRATRTAGAIYVPEISDPATYGPSTIDKANGALRLNVQLTVSSTLVTSLQPFLASGTATIAGKATLQAGVVYSNRITPSIGGTVNDWAPAGIATCYYVIPDCGAASRIITGISATGFTEGQQFWIRADNVGVGGTLTLNHADAASASGNRFGCPNVANYAIRRLAWVPIVYSPASSAANPFLVMAA